MCEKGRNTHKKSLANRMKNKIAAETSVSVSTAIIMEYNPCNIRENNELFLDMYYLVINKFLNISL